MGVEAQGAACVNRVGTTDQRRRPSIGTVTSLNDTVKLPTFRFFSMETLMTACAAPAAVVPVSRRA